MTYAIRFHRTGGPEVLQFEAVEPNGLTRLVRITSFSPNAAVKESAFKFTVPKGVKVVDIK